MTYDPCVMNKVIDGKQMTVAWNVFGLKIYHVDTKAVDYLIDQLDDTFGEAPQTKSFGKCRII
jgi:hypothetical protein